MRNKKKLFLILAAVILLIAAPLTVLAISKSAAFSPLDAIATSFGAEAKNPGVEKGVVKSVSDETPVITSEQRTIYSQKEMDASASNYEIYPTPQSIVYENSGSFNLANTTAYFEDGIDSYTKKRAEDAYKALNLSISEGAFNDSKLRVGIKGSNGSVDAYFANHAPSTSNLFDKGDSYMLLVNADGISILAKNTDAAFYALTTLKYIFMQVSNNAIKYLTIEDFSDVTFRGFIEGYYGNPWSVEDRCELMRFGGEHKLNIYFYAPKNDPKHNARWRELYTDDELQNVIKPLAEAGNESKCYFGYALHPFMNSPIQFDTEDNYQADLAIIKNKFEQVMGVGVRQIAILADDAAVPSGNPSNYVKLMTDLTNWVSSSEMQTKYPGLKTSIPFCPNDYMGWGTGAQMQALQSLPASVPIIMTGGKVWGHVSHDFVSSFRNNMQRGPYLWVNWPCSDNSKGCLTMGAHDIILHSDLTNDDASALEGIMVNPMQQSEASKEGIFCTADYAWNIWNGSDAEARKQSVWSDSFKYVDHDSPAETDNSAALRELSKHMIHQTPNGNNNYPESIELSPKFSDFKNKMDSDTLTKEDIKVVKDEFTKLKNAANTYKNKTSGNTRILGVREGDGYAVAQEQMAPWLDAWCDITDASLDLLDSLQNVIDDAGNKDIVVNKYLSGQEKYEASKNHKFTYIDFMQNAQVGTVAIVPFMNDLQTKVASEVSNLLGLDEASGDESLKLDCTLIKSSNLNVYSGSDANVLDGNDDTFVWYNPGNGDTSRAGDFIGVDTGDVKKIGKVHFVIGHDGGDKWTSYKLQYSTDNASWTDFKTYSGVSSGKDTIDENLGGVSARYIRMVNNADKHSWVKFSEIGVEKDISETVLYKSQYVKKIGNPVITLTDDTAKLTAERVILRPGEFVGIKLPRLRLVTKIDADYTQSADLVLKAGSSESELEDITNSNISYPKDLRYVRIENVGTSTVDFAINKLQVTSSEISGIKFDSSTMNTLDGQDARTRGETNLWFDGDITTSAKFSDTQDEGKDVIYDLGQIRSIKQLRAYVTSQETDYVRHGKLQVSTDKQNWIDFLDLSGSGDVDVADTKPGDAGWTADQQTPNFCYKEEVKSEAIDARYIRLVFTQTFTDKWLVMNEIVINGGEYLPITTDPTFEADPIEMAGFAPKNLTDKDLKSAFKPNMSGETSGELIYRLSSNTQVARFNIIQDASSASNASVSVRADDGWHTLDGVTLNKGLNQIDIPETYKNIYELKLNWGSVSPAFHEIITVNREAMADITTGGNQAASDVETVPISSYSGDDAKISFDSNWKFNLGDVSGAEAKVFNDASWGTVSLPHDYSIDQDYSTSNEAESGYLPGGVGWYRKGFSIDKSWLDKTISINFGGIYVDSEIYLNGVKLGENHYGYNPFSFILPSNLLKADEENVISIRVNNQIPSSRWYSGSGIYRSVTLEVNNRVHVAHLGTKVETTNAGAVSVKTNLENMSATAANVTVKQEIFEGASDSYLGSAVATVTSASTSVGAGASSTVNQNLSVSSPKLWSSWDSGDPNLYTLKTSVIQGGKVIDTYLTDFGFREISFDTTSGFKLNGKCVKLKGVCQHHDQGGLGSEAWRRAVERQVQILKDMGCNSIRVTHNPACDELIDVCNKEGILVIDEMFDGWSHPKNGNSNDFSKYFTVELTQDNNIYGKKSGETWAQFALENTMKRDMCAPSVIMYSLGNEVQEGSSDGGYEAIANNLISWAKAVDSTRPLTRGDNSRSTGGGTEGNINAALANAGGIIGFNYSNENQYLSGHNKGWVMYGSETASHINSRGIYSTKASQVLTANKRLTSYDKSAVGWGSVASDAWWRVIKDDWNLGEYVWTGFDYIGEPTPRNGTGPGAQGDWPSPKSSYFGIIDTNGLPKDNYYLYRSMWNEKSHTLHILPTWNEEDIVLENGRAEVVVYSDAPMVKLYLGDDLIGCATTTVETTAAGHTYRMFTGGNGRYVQGSKDKSFYATFSVPYKAGTLRAEACDENGHALDWECVGRSSVTTTGAASKLEMSADRASIKNDGRDLSYVTINVCDANGNIVNAAEPNIKVTVSGEGKLMALDNGIQADHTLYASSERAAGAGQLVAIVQSTNKAGTFTVSATSTGLQSASCSISTSGATSSQGAKDPVSYEISKTFYTELNNAPTLPSTAKVNLADGTQVTKQITWSDYDKTQLSVAGNQFSISGTIKDYNLSINVGVVVLDNIAAILNYSCAVHVGEVPTLPASRPAVMSNGEIVSASFPVAWTMPDDSSFANEGDVKINGTCEAFGKTFAVVANVRVSAGGAAVGSNVIGQVSTQKDGFTIGGVDDDSTRAELEKIRDNNAGTFWEGSGDLEFAYDTAQNFYKVILTFNDSVPSSSDVTLKLDGGALSVTPTVDAGAKTLTYEFGGIKSAVKLGLNFVNSVKLSEANFTNATPTFDIGSSAELKNIKVNGKDAKASHMAAHTIKVSDIFATSVEAITDNNVASTILPENNEGHIIIIAESEDHTDRIVYTIILDSPDADNIDPTDSSHDYTGTVTASAPSELRNPSGNEGPARFAVDGNEATYWHSNWANDTESGANPNDLTNLPDKRYIELTPDSALNLRAIRYKPRPTVANGIVDEYRVEVSNNGTDFTSVAAGTWEHTTAWKVANFGSVAKGVVKVRLYGVTTNGGAGDPENKFMSAAEIKLAQE